MDKISQLTLLLTYLVTNLFPFIGIYIYTCMDALKYFTVNNCFKSRYSIKQIFFLSIYLCSLDVPH